MNIILYFRRTVAYKFAITISTIIYIYVTSTQYDLETYFKDTFGNELALFRAYSSLVCVWCDIGSFFGVSSVRPWKFLVCLNDATSV